jgi:hypothetical protein
MTDGPGAVSESALGSAHRHLLWLVLAIILLGCTDAGPSQPVLRGVTSAQIVSTVIPAAPYELPEVIATAEPNWVTVSFDDALCPDAAETARDLPPSIEATFAADQIRIELTVVGKCRGNNTGDPARTRTVLIELAEPINARDITVVPNRDIG